MGSILFILAVKPLVSSLLGLLGDSDSLSSTVLSVLTWLLLITVIT